MAAKIISLIFLIAFPAVSGAMLQNKPPQKDDLENFALSICLAKGFPDGDINKEAFSAVSAYVELGSYPAEAYEAIDELAKKLLPKSYLSKNSESKLTAMIYIDLSRSAELSAIKDKYAQ